MVSQFKYILKNEGPLGLYRGIVPNFIKVVPGKKYAIYAFAGIKFKK
jgi:hypothetical protein